MTMFSRAAKSLVQNASKSTRVSGNGMRNIVSCSRGGSASVRTPTPKVNAAAGGSNTSTSFYLIGAAGVLAPAAWFYKNGKDTVA
mmetsp:Transcript_71739/g.149780  ORF Transcript_71739/g.149780 Transcript_71739/m.149780 type:complete len:85 (-) Transcript_71739:34-288(-)|eukprot:CAMPEP_0181323240 /NCGR_PEP_ID=MMETSP1101-20121128/19670_1 /TAXON_ID=46948 /ORGANISM="Rhodomonas abbreviata, Strain Caron Lab Isolate" /LENGTH=84 /DNA_ID=CAMNT_0023431235 /DNA_START=114 /DNA_END=368 /DNA_ORIENTATION=+